MLFIEVLLSLRQSYSNARLITLQRKVPHSPSRRPLSPLVPFSLVVFYFLVVAFPYQFLLSYRLEPARLLLQCHRDNGPLRHGIAISFDLLTLL